jgi:lipopolysaccharide export system protein LptA
MPNPFDPPIRPLTPAGFLLSAVWRRAGAACVVAACVVVPAVHAEKADRTQPMNAEADALRHDDANQISLFTGNVVITKGTIVIRGERVEVRQDAQGNQFGVVTAAPGAQAFFRQKREGLDEHIEGVADRIDYDGKADHVKFVGHAVMRRYRGAALADETAGSVITYENTTDTFSVDGGVASRTAANPSGRVRAMLTPTPKPEVAAPATAGNGAALRATPALTGTRP